jgi:hypothetical protein
MTCRPLPAALLLLSTAACVHNVDPKVTPAKISAVKPPIAARALLLIPASMEQYTSQSSQGMHTYRFHLGTSAAAALGDLVAASFAGTAIRRVPDSDLMSYLAAPADTAIADVLLVPTLEEGGTNQRLLDIQAEARIRLDARSFRSGATWSWEVEGRTTRAFSSLKGLTGNTLEQCLRALSDSLAAHRGELEVPAQAQTR